MSLRLENNNPINYHVETSTFALTEPTSKSYQFLGWYLDSSYTTQITEIEFGTGGNITLYAKWTTIFTVLSYDNSCVSGLTAYGKTLSKIVIPSSINGQEITSIGDNAFSRHRDTMKNQIILKKSLQLVA